MEYRCNIDTHPHCCGIGIIGSFHLYRNWNEPFPKDPTELSTKFGNYIEHEVANWISEGNNYEGQYIVQSSRIKFSKGSYQYPELDTWFDEFYGKPITTWKNHNTGNTVVLYQKRLTNSYIKKLIKEYSLDYEDY